MPENKKNILTRLLLVDDDKGFRRSLALNLQYRGYQVFEAQDGMDAIKYLNQFQMSKDAVQGVIIDAKMQGLDGFWLADQVVNRFPDLKIVIVSAFSYPKTSSQYHILTKSIQVSKLIQVLNQ